MVQSDRDILQMVERHIAAGERTITEQEHRLLQSEARGDDTSLSRSLLHNFKEALALHYRHRAAIIRELQNRGAA